MFFSLKRWRPQNLLAAWGIYWVALAGVLVAPPAMAAWQLRGPDAHGKVTGELGNEGIKLTIARQGEVTWTGSISIVALALLLAGPPLLLWLLWLAQHPRRPGDTSHSEKTAEPIALSDANQTALPHAEMPYPNAESKRTLDEVALNRRTPK